MTEHPDAAPPDVRAVRGTPAAAGAHAPVRLLPAALRTAALAADAPGAEVGAAA